nr:helix-turn-helix transcriptional regulator [Streptomyces sp. CJ_13]
MAASPFPAVDEARRSLGARLRDLRRAGGFKTARAFAARAGWSESKVSRIEHGITSPSEDDLRAYAEHSGAHQHYEDLLATASSIQEMYVEWKRVFPTASPRCRRPRCPGTSALGTFGSTSLASSPVCSRRPPTRRR